jgi:hypothetical protein
MKQILTIIAMISILASMGYSTLYLGDSTGYQPASYISLKNYKTPAQTCKATGGKVVSVMACKTASNYANWCLSGGYTCSLTDSHLIKSCQCAAGKCWNGATCA